ncbi:MAG: hypothetical protein J5644_08675, partial [Bacteroidales bacterium]|nr:hypothetical protein [Bacteroidales bacterium]
MFVTTSPGSSAPNLKNTAKYYKLMSDIDLNPGKNVAACDGDPNYLGGDPIEEWVPFNSFKGYLDGGYHIISGVYINKPTVNEVGFFKQVAENSTLRNLGIVNSYISGNNKVGGIVGYMGLSSSVTHCFVDAVIVGASSEVGGICGEATSAQVDTCYTTGSVTSRSGHLGGICGMGYTMTLTSCYSSMVINYFVNKVGGIAGELPNTAQSIVTNCYYDNQMCAPHAQDGAGYGTGKLTTEMLLSSWTDLGDNFVYMSDHYPLLKGFDATNAYVKLSTVPLVLPSTQTMQNLTENFTLGGGNDVTWVSTDDRYAEVNGSVEVKKEGWTQLVATLSGKPHTVTFYTNKLPRIGTEANPFPIDDFDDLTIFRNGVNSEAEFEYKHFIVPSRAVGKCFQQTQDISLADVENWQGALKIGNSSQHAFAGTYDGGGHAVTDLKVTSGQYGGFFGFINGGAVKNLDVVVSVFTPDIFSGPLCGQISGNSTVDNCRSIPTNPNSVVLQLKNQSSGLIGKTYSFRGTISNCQNTCNISAVGDISYLGGVIGYNESVDSIVVRKCQNYGSITGIQTSTANIKVDKIGGITSQLNGPAGKKVWFDGCTNYGAITILNESKWTQVAGIFARCPDNLKITISYCSNYGNLTASYNAAGIAAEVVKGSVTIHHCVNAGDVWVKDIKQTRPGSAYGIISRTDVYSSLNAGKITADVGGTAFGITNFDSYDCINAGEITAHSEKWCAYPLNAWDKGNQSSARNLNIGRINGVQAFWGTVNPGKTNVADEQMVFDAHTSKDKITTMETSVMLGEGLKNDDYLGANNDNWVFTEGMYPRIAGLDTLPISIVTATPVIFGTGQTINSVSSNFHVGCAIDGVEWSYNGQPVNTTCSGNKKEVDVGTNIYGVKTLTVTYKGVTKTVRFCRKVNKPTTTLNVTSVSDLKTLRDGVNSGGPFNYNGTSVPARAENTKFKQTTSLDLSGESNWEPIGKVDAQFNGTYYGDTIRNLKQSDMQNGGLFGWGYYATIDGLHMVNVKISEVRACAGSVMAVGNNATIKNCSASGEISGSTIKITNVEKTLENNIGGILGNGYYTNVTSCVNYCKMTGYDRSIVGGIVGRGYLTSNNTNNMLDSCANYAVITGDYSVGGLVGGNANVIKNSYNAGEVIGSEFAVYVGGLTGYGAYVENSFNTAMVSAASSTIQSYVGGLVGQILNASKAEIKNSYNAGIVEANRMYVGGIFGGSIKKNEWNSDVSTVNIKVHHNYVCNAVNSNSQNAGAIFGYHIVDSKLVNTNNNISNNYYDTTFCYVKGVGRKDLNNGFANNIDVTGMAEGRGTRQMVGDRLKTLLGENNFTYGDTNFYPRGLGKVANWPASLAASARLQLQAGQLSKSVDSNFTIGGCDSSVTWGLKGGGNAIIFKNNDCTNNACAAEIQKLGVVYAQSSHSGMPYKAIKLYVGNSVTNPLEIVNKTELEHFRDFINSGKEFFYNIDNKTFHASDAGIANAFPITDQGKDLYFKLTCDAVDLSNTANWVPVGTSAHPFKGFFNGGNHTITDMKCTADKDTIGFFGYLEGGSIDSLYFTNAEISGAGSYKAVVCGYNNKGQIRECKNDNASITLTGAGYNSWGGICGYNYAGQVKNCTSTGCRINNDNASVSNVGGVIGSGFDGAVEGCTVTNLEFVGSEGINNGGICGMINRHSITDCHVENSSFTYSAKNGGGICGTDSCGNIINCSFVNSTIESSKSNVGGILGDGYSGNSEFKINITDCYTEGGYIKAENGWCVGGLFGALSQLHNTFVYVNGCRNSIPVEGNQYVGGIAGQFGGEMRYCYNTATVKGNDLVGGLIGGSATHSFMWDNYNIGDVEATGDYAGGLIGKNPILQINNSFNSGRVKGNNYVGGLTGESGAVERYSYNAGQVYGGFYVGGLTGHKYRYDNAAADTSKENYNIGYVYGNNLVGALFGTVDNAEMVKNNYYDKQFSFAVGIGGEDMVGRATGKLTSEMTGTRLSLSNEWTTVDSLYPQVKNLQDTVFSKKASQATATPFILPKAMVSWNVDDAAVEKDSLRGVIPSGTRWKTGDGSIVLATQDNCNFTIRKVGILDVVAFDPTSDSLYKRVRLMVKISEEYPIVIKDYTQLSKFRDFINAGTVFYYDADNEVFYSSNDAYFRRVEIPAGGESMYFKLAKDIDFSIIPSANPWTPIGSVEDPFKGHFNGGGTTISNMTISDASGDYHGFFGYSTGTIQNLTVLNANVTGNKYTATVCGYNNGGSVIHCAAIGGTVSGNNSYTGGVCGYSKDGTINACYNSAHVSGYSYVGGVCSSIENGVASECFNMGRIEAPNNANYNYCGGITGRNTALMSDCYNTGIISGGNNVGGVVGLNKKEGLTRIYNAGTVTATGVVGGLANAYDNKDDYYPNEFTCVTDKYMAPGVGSVNTYPGYPPFDNLNQVVPSRVETKPQSMMGTALQGTLGTDNWVFTDSLYPRLKVFATGPDSMASYVSASPVFLDGGQDVKGVSSSFLVYDHFRPGQEEDLTWTIARPSDALDTTNANTTGEVNLRGCEEVTIKVLYGSLEREVDLLVKSERSYVYRDTTCGEGYTWAYNQVYYTASGNYSDQITYGSGCHEINTLYLVVPDPLALTLTPGTSCGGSNQGGAVTAEISGGVVKNNTHLYNYEWSKEGETDIVEGTTSDFTTLFENLSEGTYTLTVKDANVTTKNCQVTQTITIGAPTLVKVENVAINEPCYNDNNGKVSFDITGGNAPYKISWTSRLGDNGSDSIYVAGIFTKYNVAHDTLTFTITDANGCSMDTIIRVAGDTNKYEIIAYSETKTYDGQSINPQQYKLKVNGVESATWFTPTNPATLGTDTLFEVQFEQTDELVNAGTTPNAITVIVKKGEQDITCQLNLKKTNGSIVINPKEVTLTSGSASVICTDNCNSTIASNYNVYDGDVVVTEADYGISFSFGPDQQGLGSKQNTFTYNITNEIANNFTFTKQYGRLTVIQDGHVMVFADTVEKVYDGQALRPSFTVIGLKSDDHTVSFNYSVEGIGQGSVSGLGNNTPSPIVEHYIENVDTVSIVITNLVISQNSNPFNYTQESTINGQISITPRTITLRSNTNSKVYDRTPLIDTAVTIEGDYNGLFASQVKNLKALPETNPLINHTLDSVPNKITYAEKEGSGYNAGNYNVIKKEGKLYIDQRPVTYRGENRTVTYTGNEQCINSIIVTGLLDGDTLHGVTYQVCGTNPGTTEGTPQGTAVVKNGEAIVTENYALTAEAGSLTILGSQQQLVIRSKTDTAQYYNGENHTYQTYYVTYGGANITADANSEGKVFTLPTGDKVTITPTGTGSIGIIHVPTTPLKNEFSYELQNAGNYSNVIVDTGLISLKPRPVRIVSASFEKEYDGTRIYKNEATTAGMGFVEGDSINPVTWNFMNGTQYTEVMEGGYANQFDKPTFRSGTDPNDYDTSYVYGTLMINKAILTVKADDLTYTYGNAAPALTYTATGFKSTDDASVLTGTPELSGSFSSETPVGVYSDSIAISQGTLAANNYDFDFVKGTMVVTYRPLHIHALPMDNITYDGEPHSAPSSNYSIVNEDLCSGHVVTSVSVNGSARLAGHHSNAINITNCTVKNANDVDVTSNYQLMSVDTFIHINAKPLTISVSKDGTCEYDGHPHCEDALKVLSNGLKYTVEGLVEKDAISHIAYSGGGTAYSEDAYSVNVNPNELFITNIDLEPNVNVKSCYDITYNDGNIRITPNYIPITIESGSKNDFFYTGEAQQHIQYIVYYNDSTTNVTGPVISGNSRIFTLPTGDMITITPTASITQPSQNPVANTFTYVLNNTGSYLGQRDTILGELRINSVTRKVEVISESTTFPYDGIVHTYPYYTVKFDNTAVATATSSTHIQIPATGHYVDITPTFAGISLVGDADNTFTYAIKDESGMDVSEMYVNKDTTIGLLRILSPALILTAPSDSKPYDGTALTCDGTGVNKVQATGLPEGLTLEATASGSQTYVGSSFNVVNSYVIKQGDVDVTSSFTNVTLMKGTLTVTENTKSVVISSSTKSWPYDGQPHTDEVYTVTYDGTEVTADATGKVFELSTGDKIEITPTPSSSVTYVADGEVSNAFTYTLEHANCYHNVSKTEGKLEIIKADLTIAAKPQEYTYNGTAQGPEGTHTENVDTYVTVGALGTGDALTSITLSGVRTEIGTHTEAIEPSAAVIEKNGTDVTGNYDITYTKATLTILPPPLTVKADTLSKVYDGDPLVGAGHSNQTEAVFTYRYKDSNDQWSEYSSTVPSITNVGTLTYQVKATYNNFIVESDEATLTVTPVTETVTVTIVGATDSQVYDGEEHSVNGYTISISEPLYTEAMFSKPAQDAAVATASQTAMGTATMTLSTSDFANTTPNFSNVTFEVTPGSMTISQRNLTVTAASDSKMYDGTALTKNEATASTLADGDVLDSYTVTGSQTVVGTSDNVPSAAVIKNASNEDVTASYNITYANGTLEVTQKAITITADDATRVYDGTALTKSTYTHTDLAAGDTITSVTVTGSQTVVGSSDNVPRAAVIKNA